MNLHEHFSDTLDRVDHTGPDLARMTATARRRGTGIRRRRTAGVAVAAGVAALALTGTVLAAIGGTGGGSTPVASDPGAAPVVTPDLGGPTAPTTGEAAVLALSWAATQQRAGSAPGLAGQHSETSGDYYAELRWDDADGLGDSEVGLNVQHGRGMHAVCDDPLQLGCRQTRLPDGSRLTTYREVADVPGGPGTRLVADLLRPDRIRVVAAATDGFDVAVDGGAWDRTRPAPAFTLDDLTTIARLPMWGDELPVAFVEAGRTLSGYVDRNDDIS